MMKRLEATVTGRVQGVGFRDYAKREARRLGLTGWVRNEPDGSVCVVAEGPEEALDGLVEALREGPGTARVKRIDATRAPARGDLGAFEIRHA